MRIASAFCCDSIPMIVEPPANLPLFQIHDGKSGRGAKLLRS